MKNEKKIENSFEDSEYLSTSLSSGSDENQQLAETGFLNNSSFDVPNLLNLNQPPISTPEFDSPTYNYETHNILASTSTVHTQIKNKLSLFQQFPPVNCKHKMISVSTGFDFRNIDNGIIPTNVTDSNNIFDQNDEPQIKIIKKDSPIILGDLVTENSSNAVDNELNNKLESTLPISESNSDLSFNGRIDSLNSNNNFNVIVNTNENSRDIFLQSVKSPNITKNCKLLKHDTSNLMYTNEKSPDLFEDEDDEVIETRESSYSNATETTLTADTNNCDVEVGSIANDKSGCESLSESFDENKIKVNPSGHIKHEEILLKRLQMSLTGILPPPSITISQINITKMIQLYKENNEKYIISSSTKREEQFSSSKDLNTDTIRPVSLLTPTHTVEETINMEWPQVKEIKNHGIHYNRSKFSERFENLSLRYVERYVGAETSSSFSMPASPTSAKKRNMRIKLLAKSPGNRLSHLARRRAIFSSEHLAGQSSKSSLNLTLDAKRQILLDPKKSQRNGRKTLTPKRRTPGRRTPSRRTPSRRTPSRRTPGRRKTPLSKNKNKLSKNLFGASSSTSKNNRPTTNTSDPVLRETSKRALFQSPPKSKPLVPQITPEVANRVQKSKRVLFTPEKLSRSTSMNAVNSLPSENSEKVKLRYNSLMCLNELNENTTLKLSNLKRKRSEYETENNENKLTPNSLKFVKSQSFCANTENNNPDNINTISSESGRNLFYRSTSEIIPSTSGSQSTSSQLSEHHRKKLFWAVSHALQTKQINVKHPNFKQYASVLARATKRLYLEYEEHKLGSTSEKMMKLTSRLVFNVIQGKGVDEVYEIESINLENAKNKLERSQASFQFLESKAAFEGEIQ